MTASGGGHTGFAIAVARELPSDVEIVFTVARGDAFSRRKIDSLGRNSVIIEHARGRGPLESLLPAMPRLFKSFLEASVRLPKVDAALCTGHNNSVPPCIVARLKGARLVSLEDVYRVESRSRAISLLSKISEAVALHWEFQRRLYPRKGIVVGPVFEPPKYKPSRGDYILVTTGTYGYEELFNVMYRLWAEGRLKSRLILQTGMVPPEKYRGSGVEAFSFDPDIDRFIAGARVVVTHQGMTAINAALGYGKPTIIVYNPRWKLAAPASEVRVVAEHLGLGFLERPDPDALARLIEESRPPNFRGDTKGASRLARMLVDLATRS